MAMEIQTHRPFGKFTREKVMNLEGESEVLTDQSINLHAAMARRWKRDFENKTGITLKKRANEYKNCHFTRDELAMRVKAGGGDAPDGKGWQEDPRNIAAQNELGGQYFAEGEEAMGKYAESIGIDLKQAQTALRTKGIHLMLNEREEREGQMTDKGFVTRGRTPFTNGTVTNATSIDYLQFVQMQISHGNALDACIGQRHTIPNGSKTLEIKRLGYGQAYLQGESTTAQYNTVPEVSPETGTTVIDPLKMMMSMWASGDYEENSFYEWLPAMEEAARIGRGIARQHLFLRGHAETTAALNINAFGGALELGANDLRRAMNGFYGANWAGTHLGGVADNGFKGVDMAGAIANLNMIPGLRAKMNKYGVDPKPLRFICGARTRAQFAIDGKARPDTYSMLVRRGEGGTYYIDDVEVVVLPDSNITNANTAGMPNYALWNQEGNPINLAIDGTYTGTGTYTAGVLVNISNWIEAIKRMWNWLVVRLPLGDQVAVVGSERFGIGAIHPNISELVAYGLSIA